VSDTLLTQGHHYMHLADLKSYLEADQRLTALYAVGEAWARKAIAGCRKCSSDHTIAQIRRRNLASEALSGEKA
jgi:starch phosphorylase